MQRLDPAEFRLCRNWIVQSLDPAEFALWRIWIIWILQSLDYAEIGCCRIVYPTVHMYNIGI